MKKELIDKMRDATGLTDYHLVGPDKDREVFYGNHNLIKGVTSDNYAITSDRFPMIGTYGLGPCIAIAGIDKKTKTAFLSHNVAIKKLDELNDPMFRELESRGIDKNNLEFYIVGGNEQYAHHITDIKNYLNQNVENPNIVYEDTIKGNDPRGLGKSFILDSENGEFYSHNGFQMFK